VVGRGESPLKRGEGGMLFISTAKSKREERVGAKKRKLPRKGGGKGEDRKGKRGVGVGLKR